MALLGKHCCRAPILRFLIAGDHRVEVEDDSADLSLRTHVSIYGAMASDAQDRFGKAERHENERRQEQVT